MFLQGQDLHFYYGRRFSSLRNLNFFSKPEHPRLKVKKQTERTKNVKCLTLSFTFEDFSRCHRRRCTSIAFVLFSVFYQHLCSEDGKERHFFVRKKCPFISFLTLCVVSFNNIFACVGVTSSCQIQISG